MGASDSAHDETLAAIDMLFDAYPKNRVNKNTGLVYAEALAAYTPENVRNAVRQMIGSSKFLPSVAELISIINSRGERKETKGYQEYTPEGEAIRKRVLDEQWGPNRKIPAQWPYVWSKV